jgi:hypothetical protein
MDEPTPTINGEKFSPKHDVIDEFEIASDLLHPGEVLPEKKDIYEEYGEYKVKVAEAGVDYRGMPLINFLGELRPHYSAMDKEMVENLRIEMISEARTISRLYPELGVLSDDKLMDLGNNALHTYLREIKKQVNGIKYGLMYEKAIVTTCVVVEAILKSLGVKAVENFTENNIKVLPIFRMMAGNMANTYGGGVVESWPVSYQIGGIVTLMIVMYGATNYIGGKKGAAIYQLVSDVATKQLVASTPQSPQIQPSVHLGKTEQPAASGGGLFDLMGKVTDLAPMIGAFMKSGDEKPEKERKNKRYRR